MGTLLLLRHGRTSANANGILAGRLPGIELDEVGLASCELLRNKFADLDVKQVFASPLERTVQTANQIFPNHSVTHVPELIECEYGDWTGRKLSDLAKEPLWPVVRDTPHLAEFPNGETMQQMSDRAVSAIARIDQELTEQFGKNFIWAAVSHGDVIKAIIADALGLELAKFQRIYVEPASVSVLNFTENGPSVMKVNESGDGWLTAWAKINEEKLAEPTVGGQTGSETK